MSDQRIAKTRRNIRTAIIVAISFVVLSSRTAYGLTNYLFFALLNQAHDIVDAMTQLPTEKGILLHAIIMACITLGMLM